MAILHDIDLRHCARELEVLVHCQGKKSTGLCIISKDWMFQNGKMQLFHRKIVQYVIEAGSWSLIPFQENIILLI